MKDDLIERCARAICREIGRDPDECLQGTAGSNIPFECHLRLWETKTGSARAILAIARPAILEEAAEAADANYVNVEWDDGDGGEYGHGYENSAEEIATAIRSLSRTTGQGGEMEATDLYARTIAYDYGDEERSALMKKVWSVTPWMVDVFTDRLCSEREREICQWCREHFGDEAHPIHGMPGSWQRGSATIHGWTWYGFATEPMMNAFCATWCPPESAIANTTGQEGER